MRLLLATTCCCTLVLLSSAEHNPSSPTGTVQSSSSSSPDETMSHRHLKIENLADARFNFGMEALRQVADIRSQDNVFFSPQSLHEALMLVYFGARRATEAQLKRALYIPEDFSKDDLQKIYRSERSDMLARQVNASESYEYKSANALWLASDKRVRESIKSFFGEELRLADFKSNPGAVRAQINDWVSSTTKGNIKDLLPENTIDESTDAVLANAVYFKGLWQSRFPPENSQQDEFQTAEGGNGTVLMTTFMRQKGSFNHMFSEELGADILELPYKGDDVSMYIFLPAFSPATATREASDGLRALLRRIAGSDEGLEILRSILDSGMSARDVELAMPKFSLEQSAPVKELLSAMGASAVIEPDTTDLTGFVEEGERSPYLGDAVHRARIELDEEGTTAAAATALFSFRSSRPTEPVVFNANHPFAYFVYDRPSRALLFAGLYRKPSRL